MGDLEDTLLIRAGVRAHRCRMLLSAPTSAPVSAPTHGPVGGPVPRANRGVKRRRLLLLVVAAVVLTLGGSAVVAWRADRHLEAQLRHFDRVFDGLSQRPAEAGSGDARDALDVLVVGTDRRSESATTGDAAVQPAWVPGEQRTDVVMWVHVDAAREHVAVVSLPRDAWVAIPGHGEAKVNAAYSYGGPSLAVTTLEQLTGVRLDHLAVVDWTGFAALVDETGGVDVQVPATVVDTRHQVVWARGRQHLDGAAALMYARQRYGLPQGDLDRVRRHHALVRGLLRAVAEHTGPSSPVGTYRLLDSLTRHVTVDDEWSYAELRSLFWDLRGLQGSDVTYVVAPVADLGWEGEQSVVHLDLQANRELWDAVSRDEVDAWALDHPEHLTVGLVR